MKLKLPIALSATLLAGGLHAAPFPGFDIEAMTMGGTGAATASAYAAYSNPALIASYGRGGQDFILETSMHWTERDEHELLDLLDGFQSASGAGNAAAAAQALSALGGKTVYHDLHADIAAVLRSPEGNTEIYVNTYSYTSARAQVDGADLAALGGGIPASYASRVQIRGLTVVDAGISYSGLYTVPQRLIGQISYGITAKVLTGKNHAIDAPVDSAEVDGLYGTGRTTQRVNLDLGVAKEWGRVWTVGVAAKNIVPRRFPGADKDITLGPSLRVGAARHGRSHTLAADFDLLPNREVGFLGKTQMLTAGGELQFGRHLRLRGGIGQDLRGSLPTQISAGFGYVGTSLHFGLGVLASDLGYEGIAMQAAVGF